MCLHNIVSHLLTIDFPPLNKSIFAYFRVQKKSRIGFCQAKQKKGSFHKPTNYEPNFVLHSHPKKKHKHQQTIRNKRCDYRIRLDRHCRSNPFYVTFSIWLTILKAKGLPIAEVSMLVDSNRDISVLTYLNSLCLLFFLSQTSNVKQFSYYSLRMTVFKPKTSI